MKPNRKPRNPCFSSGPTAKFSGWSIDHINTSILGRSHRAEVAKEILEELINKTRSVLEIPIEHRIAILPGSATGAMETALWNLIGQRPIDVLAWDVFGHLWKHDLQNIMKLPDVHTHEAPFGDICDLSKVNQDHDIVFTANGSTSGACIKDYSWISDDRKGLTFCDATSAVFCMPLDWSKLDLTAFSWQKGLGGEAAHGMLVVSQKAYEQLQKYTPSWSIPLLFSLKSRGKVRDTLYNGLTINTPSMMCVSDCIQILEWAESLGGTKGLQAKTNENAARLTAWVEKTDWIDFTAKDPTSRSPSSLCLNITTPEFIALDEIQQRALIQKLSDLLSSENAGHEVRNHILSPPSLRIWCGPTVEAEDISILTEWLDWGWKEVNQ